MQKISADIEDNLLEKLRKEAKENMRSLTAQLCFILKERYTK